MTERNEEYYALKDRLDKWGVWLILVYPFFGGIILLFGGMWLAHKYLSGPWEISGFLIGGFLWQGIALYLWKTKFGFIMYSKETCQKCNMAMARWNGVWLVQDHICRECGNNNSIDLKASINSR